MKILGWILVVISSLNLVTTIATFSTGAEIIGIDRISQRIGTACGLLILGVFLIQRAAKKASEENELQDWMDKS
tara:strand:- start:209 stop:430 length:222 start_codon:yes stop_codon:yes gene_type:complete